MRPIALHRLARIVLVLAFVTTLALGIVWWLSMDESFLAARRATASSTGRRDSNRVAVIVSRGRIDLNIEITHLRGGTFTDGAQVTRWTFDRTGANFDLPKLNGPAWLRRLGVEVGRWTYGGPLTSATPTTQRITGTATSSDLRLIVPIWIVMLPFALTFAIAAWRVARWHRRRRVGLCPSCGYDLRATPDRCPECGLGQDSAATAPAAQS
jgi:hypothetical protein